MGAIKQCLYNKIGLVISSVCFLIRVLPDFAVYPQLIPNGPVNNLHLFKNIAVLEQCCRKERKKKCVCVCVCVRARINAGMSCLDGNEGNLKMGNASQIK